MLRHIAIPSFLLSVMPFPLRRGLAATPGWFGRKQADCDGHHRSGRTPNLFGAKQIDQASAESWATIVGRKFRHAAWLIAQLSDAIAPMPFNYGCLPISRILGEPVTSP